MPDDKNAKVDDQDKQPEQPTPKVDAVADLRDQLRRQWPGQNWETR